MKRAAEFTANEIRVIYPKFGKRLNFDILNLLRQYKSNKQN